MAQRHTEEMKPRSLVLCFDGTSDKFNRNNTNVVKMFALLKKGGNEQLTFYQAGIGIWFRSGAVSPIFEWGSKVLDFAFAWDLDAHVIEGYKFLMETYRTDDKICIFGFSRGAYTARALAGLLYKVGLLPRENLSQISFAYKMYKRTDAKGLRLCAGFKETYCQTVSVEFIGVWDTVSSAGVLSNRSLPFTNSNNAIKTFRHALSLDEHRTKFRPNYYHRTAPSPGATDINPDRSSSVKGSSSSLPSALSEEEQAQVEQKRKKTWGGFFNRYGSTAKSNKTKEGFNSNAVGAGELDDVMEVWFSGCHGDIGGGDVSNDVQQSLSDITLRWMVREVIASGCGVIFEPSALLRAKIDLEPEPTTSEKEIDFTDALEPLQDGLRNNILWWLLEILPFPDSSQDAKGAWHTTRIPNMGRGRQIVDLHPKFHITVKKRMESQLKYTPKAKWTPNSEVYLD